MSSTRDSSSANRSSSRIASAGFDPGGALFGLFNAAYFGEPVDARALVYANNRVPKIRVLDLDSLHARLRSMAAAELTPIHSTGSYRLFQLQDTDGNRIEFYGSEG